MSTRCANRRSQAYGSRAWEEGEARREGFYLIANFHDTFLGEGAHFDHANVVLTELLEDGLNGRVRGRERWTECRPYLFLVGEFIETFDVDFVHDDQERLVGEQHFDVVEEIELDNERCLADVGQSE